MRTNSPEHAHTQPVQLMCAENLPRGECTMPLGSQATWGKLEQALATRSETGLNEAFTSFQQIVAAKNEGFFDKKTAEAAVVLACEELYRHRMGQEPCDGTVFTKVAGTLSQIREELLRSGKIDGQAYEFEIRILEELLLHSKQAYPASPREETSTADPRANHDVYIIRNKGFSKVPISVKLGPKKTSHYAHGVRSVSRRDYERSGVTLWGYIEGRVPDLAFM